MLLIDDLKGKHSIIFGFLVVSSSFVSSVRRKCKPQLWNSTFEVKRNSIWFILDISMVIFIQILFFLLLFLLSVKFYVWVRWDEIEKEKSTIDSWLKNNNNQTKYVSCLTGWQLLDVLDLNCRQKQHNSIIMPQILIRTNNNNNDFEFISSDPFLNVFICRVLILSNCGLKQIASSSIQTNRNIILKREWTKE